MHNCSDFSFWLSAYIARVQIRGAFFCHLQSISKACLTSCRVKVYEIDITLVVTRFEVCNVMTTGVHLKSVRIDKLASCLRFGEDNFSPLQEIQDRVTNLVCCGRGKRAKPGWYKNNRFPSTRTKIPISPIGGTLEIETGVAHDPERIRRPYARFEFNVQRIASGDYARTRFREIMDAIIPHGGYERLCNEGYVNKVEFAADFLNQVPEAIDGYYPRFQHFIYYHRDGACKTINLINREKNRTKEKSIYDKWRSDKERLNHIRRGQILRIEAKRTLNRDRDYRELHLGELGILPTPFVGLRVFDRGRIERVFSANRHRSFLEHVREKGTQSALARNRGQRKEKRIQMLSDCEVDWWKPEEVWERRHNAILQGLTLCSSP